MSYAEVAVNSPIAQRRVFSYSIPPRLSVRAGQAVMVPFGPRILQGVVLDLTEIPAVPETKDIISVIDPEPLLTSSRIDLVRWISSYYLSPLFDAVSLMLPPGFEQHLVTFIELAPAAPAEAADYSVEEQRVVDLLQKGRQPVGAIERLLGKRQAQKTVDRLVRLKLVLRTQELSGSRIRPKTVSFLRIAGDPEAALASLSSRAVQQAALLRFLAESDKPVPAIEAMRESGSAPAAVKALEKRGLIVRHEVRVMRDPLGSREWVLTGPPQLTEPQQAAVTAIRGALHDGSTRGKAFLLHGVTGSGKTEVYLRALAEAVSMGKRGIILVPEIALTAQTIERFASRFPGRVAIFHSGLTPGERFDMWQQIAAGDCDVVVGPRSALFAPLPNLGLIVLDEEHEWTFKQQESPRYHAREVALRLAASEGAVVVMGSATPSVESYLRTETGEFKLLELPHRITVRGDTPLPEATIVDMRGELRKGNLSIFSRALDQALESTLRRGEQAILFLNRRGTATIVQCRACGAAIRCPGCDLPFTYHGPGELLICHQCGRRRGVPGRCPSCNSNKVRYLGAGTQKIEEEVSKRFPSARVLRWDKDSTRGRESHEGILQKFRERQADVLVGTQMIAKGLDFPEVTLVGVISADTMIHFPDFRAGERSFQLLSQVAGRSGRGAEPGRVVVQTYSPDHYAIRAAAMNDYAGFYEREIRYRREHDNPPFTQLALVVFTHTNEESCARQARTLAGRLREEIDARGLPLHVLGPAPMFFRKIRGYYRWQVIVRGRDVSSFLSDVALPQSCTVDIDPLSVL